MARAASPKTKLKIYRAKRDFERTAEPSGEKAVTKSDQLRFVIQKHAATRLHYDLRLEIGGVFKSWAVTRGPSLNPADKRLAVEVEDHPLDYGDFEGTIPKGEYGGGTVLLWDRGYWAPEDGADPEKALKKGELKFVMAGEKLGGSWVLVRMKRRDGEKRDNWLLIKHDDAYARKTDVTKKDHSVASGRTMAIIAKGEGDAPEPFMLKKATAKDAVWHSKPARELKAPANKKPRAQAKAAPRTRTVKAQTKLPGFIAPQLCKLVERAPDGDEWAHEVKLDGYRMQMRVEGGKVQLFTRKGLDWTARFPEITAAGEQLPDCILDGEICALDEDGVSSFAGLQDALGNHETADLVFFLFDALWIDGADLRGEKLKERKAALERLIGKSSDPLRFLSHVKSAGDAVLEAACNMHWEGVVSKRQDAPYQSGRSGDWLKSKCRAGQEVVIGGWTEMNGRFKSLLAGIYKDKALVYAGRIGTGYGRDVVTRLLPHLKKAAAKTAPFQDKPRAGAGEKINWLKPSLVAEIEFAGWTGDNQLRQAAFKGLREDKEPSAITIERPAPPNGKAASTRKAAAPASHALIRASKIKLTNPDKILWPKTSETRAVTKQDLAAYMAAIAERMMPHIKGRPCSILRTPDGIEGMTFFQRHADKGASNLITQVTFDDDKKPYIQFDRPEALIAAAQSGATELHPWNCQPFDLETPGRFVFDLDPAPDVAFDAVIAAAKEMKERLEALGLTPFCKTTGGKGLHVVTPLAKPRGGAALRWPEAKAFAREVCAQMAADSPSLYLIKMSKKERAGRIFLDYLRNDQTATAVAPYSPRARPGATVSMPLKWTQVRKELDPKAFNMLTTPALIAKADPWADYAKAAASFPVAAKKLGLR